MIKGLVNIKTSKLIKIAIVAAIYAIITIFVPTGNGVVQFRIAEILTLLPLIDPLYIVSLTIGCVITNFFVPSGLGLLDVVIGSFATLLATFWVFKFRKNMWIASLGPVLNAPILATAGLLVGWPFWITLGGIAATEIFIVTIIGVPVFKVIFRNKQLVELLKIK